VSVQNLNNTPSLGPLTEDDFPSANDNRPGNGAGVVLWPLAVLAAVACASFLVLVAKR
jgi:hypothetical protein